MIHIFYDPTTGKIDSFGSDANPAPRDGLSLAFSESHPDYITQKIDVATGRIVSKSDAEIAHENQPSMTEVRAAVELELWRSDKFVLQDFPVSQDVCAAWMVYRKALRDLSKGDPRPTSAAMIAAWPLDPNGKDAITNLRNRNQ